jgi:antirestriction protein ArdC
MAFTRDLAEQVTARIIKEMENGVMPWRKPWHARATSDSPLPANAISRHAYRGINVWLLWSEQIDHGYESPLWLTFKQCRAAADNSHVRKGEHGSKIYFYKPLEVKDRDNPEKTRLVPILREFTVFNVCQCENLPEHVTGLAPRSKIALDRDFDHMIGRTDVDLRHSGDRAFYAAGPDFVQMPYVSDFETVDTYRAVLAHEMTHWTGHKSRLNRTFGQTFGDKNYAAEELVAEMGSAFMAAAYGFESIVRHSDYIASWIKVLKDNPRALFSASSLAQKAVDFLQKTSGDDAIETVEALAA